MEMTGEQLVASPQELVWKALNDQHVLKQCIAGCQVLEPEQDSEYRIEMLAAVGPIKARFKGRLSLSDMTPPDSYALSFEGSGGPAGFGKGTAKVVLSAAPGGTLLSYSVSARIGGKLAQVGSRLIDGVAKKMADDFFGKFTQLMADYSSPSPASPVEDSGPVGTTARAAAVQAGVAQADSGRSAAPAASHVPPAVPPTGQVPPQPAAAGYAQVAGMVPIVAWVPAGSVLPTGPVLAPVRAPIHPLWWILGTALFMVLVYFAFVRAG